MSLNARHELFSCVAPRYRAANKAEKQLILDEFTASTGYHRKYAIALLNQPPAIQGTRSARRGGRSRKGQYPPEVQAALLTIWEAAGRICSKRLVPFLPELVEVMERQGYLSLSTQAREQLLAISPATVDRLLAPARQAGKARGRTTTLPGSLLKHHVPIRTFSDWDDLRPGFLEADLVAHCGTSTAGSYLHTLTMTDVATGWTECLALLYRDQDTVLRGFRAGRERLPFPLLGLDTDNGSEFLNVMLLGYCQREQITFTRSRAYQKNDQCHVEEKNGSVVRRFVGYDRLEGIQACRALAELYQRMRLWVNFFQPSMKLISKERRGSKIIKKYDQARTPFQRVLASQEISEQAKQALGEQFEALDPVRLRAELEALQDRLWQYANRPARSLDTQGQVPVIEPVTGAVATLSLSGVIVQQGGIGGDGAGQVAPVSPSARGSANPARLSPSERMYHKAKRKGRYHLVKHTWRTWPDAFAGVWPEIEEQLRGQPHLEAKRLFQGLQERHPGRFKAGQLRTLQRRVKAWRQRQASMLSEQIGLVLGQAEGDGSCEAGPVEVAVSVVEDRSSGMGRVSQPFTGLGGLCGGEQAQRLFSSTQRIYKESLAYLSISHVATTGVPNWTG